MPRTFIKKILIGLITVFITFTAIAAPYNIYDSIPSGIARLIANTHTNPQANIAVIVQSMNTGHVYYSRNANEFFAPASVQKLFTVSSALLNLTPHFRFTTRVFTTGKINQGVLNGDLVFQFNGDPSLKKWDVIALVKKIQTLGIRRINGNLIVDDTAFNHIPYPAGWLWSDLITDFAAPLNTVIIDRNSFGLRFIPARRAGEKPEIISSMPPGAATFINEMKTTRYPKWNCPVNIVSNEQNQYLVRGCLSQRSGTQYRTLAIRNMQMYTEHLLPELLRQNDILLNGRVFSAKTPVNSQLLAEHFSAPLSTVIIHLLKTSDNLYADALFKKIGEYHGHTPGSWENGIEAVLSTLLRDVGIQPNQLSIVDGSGLSLYDKVTPNAVSQMLHYIHQNTMLRDSLIPALPIAGVDGTLAMRMPILARGDRVHAKTGSMTGVSSLAGFVKTKHHGTLSFVVMINHIPKDRWPYILLENHIVEFLAMTRG